MSWIKEHSITKAWENGSVIEPKNLHRLISRHKGWLPENPKNRHRLRSRITTKVGTGYLFFIVMTVRIPVNVYRATPVASLAVDDDTTNSNPLAAVRAKCIQSETFW